MLIFLAAVCLSEMLQTNPQGLQDRYPNILKASPHLFNTLTFGHILVANFHSWVQQTLNQIRGVDSHQVGSFVSTWSRETRFQLTLNFYLETCPAKEKILSTSTSKDKLGLGLLMIRVRHACTLPYGRPSN